MKIRQRNKEHKSAKQSLKLDIKILYGVLFMKKNVTSQSEQVYVSNR